MVRPRRKPVRSGKLAPVQTPENLGGLNEHPWMQLLYGAPVVYAPGKSVIYKNVGRASGSSGLDNAQIP